jgi:hypothetical protein
LARGWFIRDWQVGREVATGPFGIKKDIYQNGRVLRPVTFTATRRAC